MPARNKKNFRSTKSGAGMTQAGVKAYRRGWNPGSKLKTAVTGKVKKGSKDAKRRKSFCARSAGQMKKFPKAAKNPNSRLRQARETLEMLTSFNRPNSKYSRNMAEGRVEKTKANRRPMLLKHVLKPYHGEESYR